MTQNKKIVLIILDGLGVGELPDAHLFNDRGSNTLKGISEAKRLNIPNLLSLGIGNVSNLLNVIYPGKVTGCYGKMHELSAGKDSTTGHWEIGGLIQSQPFPVFPQGFGKEIIDKFLESNSIRGILGNKPASGTEIIKELGEDHLKTGFPIVYTSADSVFQIAAHEEIIPLERLYEICRITRNEVMTGPYAVARIIARPFIGKKGDFRRTSNRRDFSLTPPKDTILDILQKNSVNTIGVGKIDDLFAGQGLNVKVHTKSNAEGISETIKLIKEHNHGFIFVNLVDFDMLYGHRNDALGYAEALEYFDNKLKTIMLELREDDLLMITADHGNDPSDISTDHTREYVPILTFSKGGKKGINLGIRDSFSDVGKTVLDFFGIDGDIAGVSFLSKL